MKLVVGLGNPGKEYDKTRHNVGFMVIDNYICHLNISDTMWKKKFNSLHLQTDINGEKVILMKTEILLILHVFLQVLDLILFILVYNLFQI